MTLLKQKQHLSFLGFILFFSLNTFCANAINDRIISASPIDSSDHSSTIKPFQKGSLPASVRDFTTLNSILSVKPPFQGGTSCENAALMCQGAFPFTGSIVTNPITDASKYAALCFRTSVDNPVWYSFIAGATDIEFRITSGFCAEGVQAAIVQSDDCSSFTLTNGLCCAATNSCINRIDASTSKKLDAFGLVIGKTYYLVIDGYGTNDGILGACDFTVDLLSPASSIINSNAAFAQVTGPTSACPNQNGLEFKVSPTTVAQKYKWTTTNGAVVNGSSIDTLVKVNWGTAAADVCVEISTTCTVSSASKCKPVTIGQSAIRYVDTVLCAGTSITFGSETINTDKVNYRIKLPILSVGGCDSVVDLTLTYINLTVFPIPPLSKSGDLSCSINTVTLKSPIVGFFPVAATTIFEWRNPANTVIGNATPIAVSQPGIYSLTIKSTFRNVTCSAPMQTITVNQLSSGLPSIRYIDTVLCQGGSIKVGNQTFNTTGNFDINFPNGSYTGCDSLVKLKLTVLNIFINPIGKSNDLSCSINTVKLFSSTVSVSPNNAQTVFEWRNSANVLIGNGTTIDVNQKGTYSVFVKATLNDVTCESNTETITVNQTGIVPARPILDGLSVPCVNTNNTYTIISPAADVKQYNWTITGGTVASPSTTTPSVLATWTGINAGKICVVAKNNCGLSDTACLDIDIKGVPTALPISGEQSNCPNTTKTYNVTPNANVTTYQWTVPSGASIASGQGSSSIQVNWGSSTGGQITMAPSNACGAGPATNLNISINTTKPTAVDIQGPKEVCPAATAKYFIPSDPSIIEYKWILPAGVTALTSLNQSSIDVRFDANTNAKICLDIKNACQLTTNMCLDVTVKTVQPDVPIITGPISVCSNDDTNFNVPNNPAITKYTWAVPTGAIITSGQGSASIQVSWGTATSGQVSLDIENACGLKNKGTASITIKDATLQDPIIAGAISVCPNAKVVYSVAPNPRIVTYKWATSSDATITASANPNEYNLSWKTAGGDVCLEYINDCGITKKSCVVVSVTSSLDSLPITGDTTVCEGKIATFAVQKDAGATGYTWTVPTGSTIQTGNNTNTITLLFGTMGGLVKVSPVGGCANGKQSSVNVTIKKKPNGPLSILGKNAVCVGDIEQYSVPTQSDAVLFKWVVPTGAVITQGINTREITVEWKTATSGDISVSGMGECGESVAKTLAVTVKNVPKPVAGFDETVCGLTYKMKATTSVNALTWSVFDKPATATALFKNPNLADSDVTVSELGDYTFVLIETNGTCIAADTVKIAFKSKPTLTLIDETCNLEATQYAVNVKINGKSPYSFKGSLIGRIVQDTFKSQPVTNGSAYDFVIIDAFGCASDTLKGQKTCNCATSAGTLKKDSLVLCFGTKGKAIHQANAITDRDDTFDFILNKGTSKALGEVIAKNKTGEFAFDPAKMQYNTVYYIHYAVGTNVRGEADQLDKCFAISNGIPIVFKEKLTASLTADTTVCEGTPASLVFQSNTNDFFKVSYQFGNETFEISKIKNLEKFDVIPSLSGSYKLVEVTNSSGCKAEVSGLANVKIRPRPTLNAGADQTVCDRTTTLNATIPPQYKSTWRTENTAKIVSINSPITPIENLQNGKNRFVISIQDSVCLNYRVSDTVDVFLPIIPKGISLGLEVFAGDSVKANVTESAPVGTYEVTALNSPASGRFAIFSNGAFNYISDPTFKGVVKFKYLICSQTCAMVCDTGEVRILVKEKTKPPRVDTVPDVDIPNAITPNGDGKNDFFVIDNIEKFTKSEFTVFNRWGEILYRSKAYNGQWGGTNQNGEPLAEGTYYYILRLNVDDGKILRGDVTILR
jgi:gliding motility-associated-like protein